MIGTRFPSQGCLLGQSPSFQNLVDGYRYSLSGKKWERIADLPRGVAAAPSPMLRIGEAHLLLPGGGDPEALGWVAANPGKSLGEHPGFSRECFAYHSVVDRWVTYGANEFPDEELGTSRVTVNTVEWEGRWFIPSGEAMPGVRSPKVFAVKAAHKGAFTGLDWGVLAIYLALLVGIGWRLSRRGGSTEDYFLAGGRIPWWAAGLSVFATQLSSLTFMATRQRSFGPTALIISRYSRLSWWRLLSSFSSCLFSGR